MVYRIQWNMSALRMNEILTQLTTWVTLDDIMLTLWTKIGTKKQIL